MQQRGMSGFIRRYAAHCRWTDPENQRFSILGDGNWTAKGANETAFDDLMIFNRPLSAVEVMSLYRRGIRKTPPDGPGPIPEIKTAPAIDGRANKAEWERAAALAKGL